VGTFYFYQICRPIVLLFWLHKQTNKKKEPPKNKKNTHTIVGREKWLLYFQV
jgi:hypothetical protein